MMKKVKVNGPKASKVYRFLKKATSNKKSITWNFSTFFVIDRHATMVHRFDLDNLDFEFEQHIEELLTEPIETAPGNKEL